MNKLNSFIPFITQHKVGLLLLIILIYFTVSLVLLNINSPVTNNRPSSENVQPTPLPNKSIPIDIKATPFPTARFSEGSDEHAENDFFKENFQDQETLADGTKKYTTFAEGGARKHVAITSSDGNTIIFQRSVVDQTKPVKLSDYQAAFGQPEQTRDGHHYYGEQARTYIYASEGLAYIANVQSGRILEIHTFAPMSVNEYLTRFAEEI